MIFVFLFLDFNIILDIPFSNTFTPPARLPCMPHVNTTRPVVPSMYNIILNTFNARLTKINKLFAYSIHLSCQFRFEHVTTRVTIVRIYDVHDLQCY